MWREIIENNVKIKFNESRYIALFVVSKSMKKLFSIYYVNIYLFSIFFSMDFARQKGVGLPNIDYTIINNKPLHNDFFSVGKLQWHLYAYREYQAN